MVETVEVPVTDILKLGRRSVRKPLRQAHRSCVQGQPLLHGKIEAILSFCSTDPRLQLFPR